MPEQSRPPWSTRLQMIIALIILFAILILVEQLLNWLFYHNH